MPFQTAKMPAPYLRQPIRKKETHTAFGKGIFYNISFALASMQGWRVTMEDAHCHEFPTRINNEIGFVGVFDGHAGDKAANYAAQSILNYIQGTQTWKFIKPGAIDPIVLARATMEGFFNCDEGMKSTPGFRDGKDNSGCTGVVAMITQANIIVGNTGDSRCVLIRNNECVFATRDHKPDDEREKHRVEQAGGHVFFGRINGDLASARSFGDFRYKKDPKLPASQQQVTVMPDIAILDRSPEDQLLILACDGIWDVMSNLECAQFILAALRLGASVMQASELVIDECLRKSSGDNMSVLIVALDAAPPEKGSANRRFTVEEVREYMLRTVL